MSDGDTPTISGPEIANRPPVVPKSTIEVQYLPKANFALQQSDVPVVRELVVTNLSESAIEDVLVTMAVSGGLSRPFELRLARLAAGETRRLGNVDLRLDPGRLANQVERERLELIVGVTCAGPDGRVDAGNWSGTLEVLAFNEWPGLSLLPEIIAAFVTPNHPSIEELLVDVRERMRAATGDPSLDGYQSRTRERPLAMVRAIYAAMRGRAIMYMTPPASYEREGQKVRTAEQVLDGRTGTCLDLSVVAASAIEQAGLRPLLLVVRGHAFVGAWLVEEHFPETTIDDAARVLNRVRLGEIAVFEATALCDGKNIDFDPAASIATERLELPDEFLAAVDVFTARRSNIRPLPPRLRDGGGFVVIAEREHRKRSADGVWPFHRLGIVLDAERIRA